MGKVILHTKDAAIPTREKLQRIYNYYMTHGNLPGWAADYGFGKQDIAKVAAALKNVKDQSAEQEMGELGKQMKKMTAKDAAVKDGETSKELQAIAERYYAEGQQLSKEGNTKAAKARWATAASYREKAARAAKLEGSKDSKDAESRMVPTASGKLVDVSKSTKVEGGYKGYSVRADKSGNAQAVPVFIPSKDSKDCAGTKDCGCGCTKDEMFTPYDSELKKHAAGAQARKVDAPKPKGRNIHIWLE